MMYGVILAAGKGTRAQSLGYPSKVLIEIKGKTLIESNIDSLKKSNITDIIIIVGHNKKYVIDKLGDGDKLGVKITYVTQEVQDGIVGAIKCLDDSGIIASNEDYVLLLGDELYSDLDLSAILDYSQKHHSDFTVTSVIDKKENIRKSFTIDYDDKNNIHFLVEKPLYAFNECRGTGCCFVGHRMMSILDEVRYNSERSQYELVDWILSARTLLLNPTIKLYIIPGQEFNVNTPEEYELAKNYFENKRLLN